MPDRLAELRRQRALVAEHLAWLDRELAEAGETATGSTTQPGTTARAPAQSVPAAAGGTDSVSAVTKVDPPEVPKPPEVPNASKILAELDASAEPNPDAAIEAIDPALRSEHRPTDIKDDVRRGCFLYLAIATLLVVGGGALLIWVAREYNKKHPPKPKAEKVEEYQP